MLPGQRALQPDLLSARAIGVLVAAALVACGTASAPPVEVDAVAPRATFTTEIARPDDHPGPVRSAKGPAVVMISKTKIFVDEQPIVLLDPDRATLAKSGVDASQKSGPFEIRPLAQALRAHAASGGEAAGELLIAADETTPYRVVAEVVHTASLNGCPMVHFLVRGGALDAKPAPEPRSSTAPAVEVKAIVTADGVAFEGDAGNVRPGCDAPGPGVAVPSAQGKIDVPGVAACAKKIKDAHPGEANVTITASPEIDLGSVIAVVDALTRHKSGKLFAHIGFGLPVGS